MVSTCGGRNCRNRSNSNHRCCYDFRYRVEDTRHVTESGRSSTLSTSTSQKHKTHSTDSKNDSSGYGCSQSKTNKTAEHNKRRRPSSHDVSPRKSRRFEETVNGGGESYFHQSKVPDNCGNRSPLLRIRNAVPGSRQHLSNDRNSRHRSRSRSIGSSHSTKRRNGIDGPTSRHHRHGGHSSERPKKRVSSRQNTKKRQRRSRERAIRKESHEHHKRQKENAVVPIGDVIKRRFEVRRVLGEGSFGQVLECLDRHTQSLVAVKALKRLDDYLEAAKHEVDVLDAIAKADRSSRSNCIVTVDFFDWHKHFYIVFPLLSCSVFSFLEGNNYEPYPTEHSTSITYQLCNAVHFMHMLGICHTDLKPENILFINSDHEEVYNENTGRYVKVLKNPTIKVIDLGSAVIEGERHPSTIQTRHYRAPEVVLENGWSYPSDMWSVGCILYELVTGQCLFMTHDNLEHLAMMERFLGPIPRHMIRASKKRRYFQKDCLDWDVNSTDGRYVRRHLKTLGETWLLTSDLSTRLAFDLVKEMLIYEPSSRITPKRSLDHPFLASCVDN